MDKESVAYSRNPPHCQRPATSCPAQRCFEVDELARHIVAIALQDAESSVFYLSLTCKLLVEPCLDMLWESMTSIEPLLELIPKDFWDGGPSGDPAQFETNSAVRSAWGRVLRYAQRIRHLTFDRRLVSVRSETLTYCVKHWTPARFVLPELRSLSFVSAMTDHEELPISDVIQAALQRIAGENLTSLKICCSFIGIKCLKAVISQYSRLEDLVVYEVLQDDPHSNAPSISDAVALIIGDSKTLRTISLPFIYLTPGALALLSQIPLRAATFSMASAVALPPQLAHISRGFGHLEELLMIVHELDDNILVLLQSIHASRLRRLTIALDNIYPVPRAAQVHACLDAISKSAYAGSLDYLWLQLWRISRDPSGYGSGDAYTIDASTLAPLLVLLELREVRVPYAVCRFGSLDESFVEELHRTLPHIEEIIF